MFPKLVRATSRLGHEVATVGRRGREVWGLIPAAQKWGLGAAVLVMVLGSTANSSIAKLVGRLFSSVATGVDKGGMSRDAVLRASLGFLVAIGVAYLVREIANVVRRFLVERACTRIDKNLCVKLVAHLLEVDLSTLSHEQVGAIHGRIARSVEGLVRFFRITFHDFLPAIFTGTIALTFAFGEEPRIALVMMCVAPLSLGITLWQIATQNGVRIGLLRIREAMDGTVVELLSGIDYIRASATHRHEILKVETTAERRRAVELRHHFEMSLFGSAKAINEGFFNLAVITVAIYFFIEGRISSGAMVALPMLFLQVMSPLNEVHRIIDEGHECSLKVADLLALLNEPVDRSFIPVDVRQPVLDGSVPLVLAEDLQVEYQDPRPGRQEGPAGGQPPDRRRGDDRRGRAVRVRQVDLAEDHDAPDPPERRQPVAGRRADRVGVPRGDRRPDRLRRPEPVRLLRDDRREHRLRHRARHDGPDPRGGADGLHRQGDRWRCPASSRPASPSAARTSRAASASGSPSPGSSSRTRRS